MQLNNKKISFNSTPLHFEPTEVLIIDQGKLILEELRKSQFAFLLKNKILLNVVLFFNGISVKNIGLPTRKTVILTLNHPKMYLQDYRKHPCFEAYRNRSFALFEAKIKISKKKNILAILRSQPKKTYHILEIGCGTGRAVLEIQSDFPNSEVNGICMPGDKEDLKKVRSFFGLGRAQAHRPIIIELDLNKKIPFVEMINYFDFIFSQATVRYIRDKISLIMNLRRLLRYGGMAVIEIHQLQIQDKKKKLIPLENFFNQKCWKNQFHYDRKTKLLYIFKTTKEDLDFALKLSPLQTKFKKAHPVPTQNSQVGWSSFYLTDG